MLPKLNVVTERFSIEATSQNDPDSKRLFVIEAESLEAARLRLPAGWIAVTGVKKEKE